MSNLSIVEYSDLGTDGRGNVVPAGSVPPITTQNVSFTSTTQSNAFNKATKLVEICADANARVVWGTNPTATTTTGSRAPAGAVIYYVIDEGMRNGTLKLAVVAE